MPKQYNTVDVAGNIHRRVKFTVKGWLNNNNQYLKELTMQIVYVFEGLKNDTTK